MKSKRTLKQIEFYPPPNEIYDMLMGEGWDYKVNKDFYRKRDRALAAALYIMALRVSEGLSLTREQVLLPDQTGDKDKVIIRGIKLAKAYRMVDKKFSCSNCGFKPVTLKFCPKCGVESLFKPERIKQLRKEQYRQAAWMPLTGARKPLTTMFLEWLDFAGIGRLFPINRSRAYQVIEPLTGYPVHYLRAWGENYLYDQWGKDPIAVSDYVKVDARTLSEYIRRGYEKYGAV